MTPADIKAHVLSTRLRPSGTLEEPGRTYPHPLPEELRSWYAYVAGGGHSVVGLLEAHYQRDRDPTDMMMPLPVRSVLRGYQIRESPVGPVVVATSDVLRYDDELGLMSPKEDDEY